MADPKKSITYYVYKNKRWHLNGKPVDVSNIIVKDANDGYWKKLLSDGTMAVQDVDKNGKPIKHTYIGGTTKQTRDKYWEQSPIINHAVDSIANRYNINPSLLRNRLNKEGFTDLAINSNNFNYNDLSKYISNYKTPTYNLLNSRSSIYDGFNYFGLDDVADLITENKVKLINENWNDSYNTNENKRVVHSANGETVVDNIGIMAATLKYFREQANKDFPNRSNDFLDKAANIYYNRGAAGGKKYIKQRRSLED